MTTPMITPDNEQFESAFCSTEQITHPKSVLQTYFSATLEKEKKIIKNLCLWFTKVTKLSTYQ